MKKILLFYLMLGALFAQVTLHIRGISGLIVVKPILNAKRQFITILLI